MGFATPVVTVRPSRGSRRKVAVEFLVDSGAVYSLVPAKVLRKLGLRPYRKVTFTLADGTKIQRQVGDAYFEIDGHRGPAPVIFGERGDEPLLGMTTLESLGLVLDPFKRRLLPMRMLLARFPTRLISSEVPPYPSALLFLDRLLPPTPPLLTGPAHIPVRS